ncbi:MAG: aminodeoxychorismate synthase component I [Rhodocyclales bacterium]|nr:aminodeoxychorismate synthase component I [Rhodocyclales bacterium]
MLDPSAPYALFDDNLDQAGDLLLTGLCQTLSCHAIDDVAPTFAAIEAARAQGRWIALALSYELGHAFEPRLRRLPPRRSPAPSPLLTAWVFTQATRMEASTTTAAMADALARLTEHQRSAVPGGLSRGITAQAHAVAVERIRALIEAGDCYQVNYTFTSHGHMSGHPLALYAALRERQPVRYGACIGHADGCILSRSPELFVERKGRTLTCKPMKGTAPAHTDPRQLRDSEKNRAENLMIVDLIRNDLGRLAPPGGVKVARLFDIEAYPGVWQMTSTITAAPVDADLQTLLRALFPCGSITGAPKIRAMEIIHDLERTPRGLYCGALGWLAPDGDLRLSVPIRTLEADNAGQFSFGLGSGIVADSDPADEWAECLVKGQFVTGMQADFSLFETLRCEPAPAERYPLLERHLARLAASARYFGFSFDPEQARSALRAAAEPLDDIHRVKLTLAPDGQSRITCAPLDPRPPEPLRVGISTHRVNAGDPLLRHKTTLRALYDAELARATALGYFDVLFFNERDELAEGARSNVFVDPGDGVLLTPPLASGVLDGVYRRALLDGGQAREARLTRADLTGARTIYVANALRGLLRVRLS